MNERIIEMAIEAELNLELQSLKVEKFAELIVRECANIALREDHDPYECIKQHFGVK